MRESDQDFNCPYCGAANTVRVEITEGRRQEFVLDCEVCCRPIKVAAGVDAEGEVELDVKQEDEQ